MQNNTYHVIAGPQFADALFEARLKFEKGVVIHGDVSGDVPRSWNGLPLATSHAEIISLLENAHRTNGKEAILVRAFFDVDGKEIVAATTAIVRDGVASMPYPFRQTDQRPNK